MHWTLHSFASFVVCVAMALTYNLLAHASCSNQHVAQLQLVLYFFFFFFSDPPKADEPEIAYTQHVPLVCVTAAFVKCVS